MTSDNSLLPILRRLDEIERKLDRMLEELRTINRPAASKSWAQMNPGTGAKRPRSIRLYAMQQSGEGQIPLRSALLYLPRRSMAEAFSSPWGFLATLHFLDNRRSVK